MKTTTEMKAYIDTVTNGDTLARLRWSMIDFGNDTDDAKEIIAYLETRLRQLKFV